MQRDSRRALFWSYFFLIIFVIFFLTPPLFMLVTSLKTSAEISAMTNPWWVFHPTLANYVELLTSPVYLTFFKNSALLSLIVVTITMIVSVLAAFSLSRMKFWGSATLATGIFLTYLVPDSLLFIPLFKIFVFLHELTGIEFIDHWWMLIFIYPTLTIPFCTWIMIGYFSSIPKELDEAALIDGAGDDAHGHRRNAPTHFARVRGQHHHADAAGRPNRDVLRRKSAVDGLVLGRSLALYQ